MKPVIYQVNHSNESALKIRKETGSMFPHYHAHKEIQCTWIERGNGILIAGETIDHFSDGDIFLINSYVPHVFRNDKKVCTAIHLFFDFTSLGSEFWKLNELNTIVKLLSNENGVIKLKNEKLEKAASLITQMKDEINFTNLILFIYFLSLFADKKDLEVISGSSLHSMIDATESMRMTEVIEFTMLNYTKHISLEKVASIAGLTIPSFCRYFKKRTNKAYLTFVNEIRINKVCGFLRTSNNKIETIAKDCGFSNLSYFNRVFKEHIGLSPKNYRQNTKMKS